MGLISKLGKVIVSKGGNARTGQQFVERVQAVQTWDLCLEAPWERRIVELSDGRSVCEIQEILYIDELKAGAGAADIGIWRTLFDRGVSTTIGELATRGLLRLSPACGKERNEMDEEHKLEEETSGTDTTQDGGPGIKRARPGAGAKRNTRRGTKASADISVIQRCMGVQPFRERVISLLVDKLRRRKNGS